MMVAEAQGDRELNDAISRVRTEWRTNDTRRIDMSDARLLFNATREGGGKYTRYHIASLLGKTQGSLHNLFLSRGLVFAAVPDGLSREAGEVQEEFPPDIDALKARVTELDSELAQERERRQFAESEVRELRAKVAEQDCMVGELRAKNAELKAQLDEDAIDIMTVRKAGET
jgi:hypothetical protein